jgi:hypothetical protein
MADEKPWYAPGHVAARGRTSEPRAREHVWALTKGGRRIDAQLLFHTEAGVEIQFLFDGVMAYARRCTRRADAVEEANAQRARLTNEGWRADEQSE